MSFEQSTQTGNVEIEGSHEGQSLEEKVSRKTSNIKGILEILLKNQKQEEGSLNKFFKAAEYFSPFARRGILEPDQNLLKKVQKLLEPIAEVLPPNVKETEALIDRLSSPELQEKILASVTLEYSESKK